MGSTTHPTSKPEIANFAELDPTRLGELLTLAQTATFRQDRIELLTAACLGKSYHAAALRGTADQPEELCCSLDSFDCVTFVETVLALSVAHSAHEFLNELLALRYYRGIPSWETRNHYSVDWIERNEKRGAVKNITPSSDSITVQRELSFLSNYPVRSHTIRYLPYSALPRHENLIQPGDLAYIGTTMATLDVRHVGFLFPEGEVLSLRHASKSRGGVREEPFAEFMARFGESPGVILVRPLEPGTAR